MELDERKRRILQAVVDDYIETAEPVGSRVLSKKEGMGFSAATIRNEMADLEEMGYLDKPHTSSGRVPSNQGYRFYVNSLMNDCKLTAMEIKRLREAMELRVRELDKLVEEASDIVSKLTKYTVIASAPRSFNNCIKNIRLLPVGVSRILLIAVTGTGVIKSRELPLLIRVSDEIINAFSEKVSEKLVGHMMRDLDDNIKEELAAMASFCPGLWETMFDCLCDWFDESSRKHVFSGGVGNIFNFPEYRDLGRAKEFIGFIDSRDNISRIMEDVDSNKRMKIIIGNENREDALKDCSIIIVNYDVGEEARGSIGIIGPTRMDYARVVSSLEVIADRLNTIIYKLFF